MALCLHFALHLQVCWEQLHSGHWSNVDVVSHGQLAA
jgi:hypothetical protein